jgi:transcriptional regulator with XRE-family HTH domain
MPKAHGYLRELLAGLRRARELAEIGAQELEERLILGPGWIERFESGETVPSVDMVLAILRETGSNLAFLLEGLPEPEAATLERCMVAEQVGADLLIHFTYTRFDAEYRLPNCKLVEFESVVKSLRDGLARLASPEGGRSEAIKSDAVAGAFLSAVRYWPAANPSDLWWFVIYRAYCDPFNHPAQFARLNFTESWKRTSGWALEKIVVRHYGPFLERHGIQLSIPDGQVKRVLVEGLGLADRIEADKIDLVLMGQTDDGPRFFGIVNVKASFAERRTDDVPLSETLSEAGYLAPLWTMDCKSSPGPKPKNRGELGPVEGRRSAKRKDIEEEGYFTGCFAYNRNTVESPATLPDERRVYRCDFSNPDDRFTGFLRERWRRFQRL